MKKQMVYACRKGDLELVKSLVEQNIKLATSRRHPFIIIAAYHGYLDIVKYLHEKGGVINTRTNQAIRNAVKNGHFETLCYLAENGADVTADDNECMKMAINNKDIQFIEYLVSKGANINIRDHYMGGAPYTGDICTYVLDLLNDNKLELIKKLILLGADITRDRGWIVREFILTGNIEIVKFLIPDLIKDPFMIYIGIKLAKLKGHVEISEYLQGLYYIIKEDK